MGDGVQAELDVVKERLSAALDKIRAVQQEKVELQELVDAAEAEAEITREERDEARQTVATLERTMISARAIAASREHGDCSALEQRVEELEQELQEASSQTSEAQAKAAEADAQVSRIWERTQRVLQGLTPEGRQEKAQTLEVELHSTQRQLTEAQTQARDYEELSQQLQSQMEKLRTRAKASGADEAAATQQCNARIQQLEARLSDAIERNAILAAASDPREETPAVALLQLQCRMKQLQVLDGVLRRWGHVELQRSLNSWRHRMAITEIKERSQRNIRGLNQKLEVTREELKAAQEERDEAVAALDHAISLYPSLTEQLDS